MPAPDHNDGTRGVGLGNKGGFGKSGKGHEYSGTSKSGALAGRPQLNVDFDLDNLGWGDVAKAVAGLALGANPIGIVAGGLASALGLSLGGLSDFDFSSGVPGDPSGKGPGGSGTGGGPGGPARLANQNLGLSSLVPGSTTEPAPPEALRTAADLDIHFADLNRIALGQADSRAALERVGTSPEQIMFDYRESFPEFGDSMSNLSLAEIIEKFGNMSPNPEPFAEGGRVGENLTSRGDERVRPRPDTTSDSVSTDLARFSQMLKDLMMTGTSEGGSENPFGAPDKPQARRPIIPGGLIPSQTGSPRHGGDAEAFRFVMPPRDNSPLNIIPDGARPEIEVEPLAPPVAPAESTPTEDFVQPYRYTMRDYETDSEFNLSRRELTAFETLTREGLSGREAMDRVKGMTPEQLDLMVEVVNSSESFKNGGDVMTPDELGQMGSMGFAGGGDTGRGQFRNPRGMGQSQIPRPINSPLAPVSDPAPTGLPSVLTEPPRTVDLATQGFSDIGGPPGHFAKMQEEFNRRNGIYNPYLEEPSVPSEMSPSSPPRTSPPMAEPVEGGWFQQFFGNDQAPPPQQTTMSPSPTQTAPAPNWQRPSALTRFNQPRPGSGRFFKDGGETQRPAPGLLQDNPQRTVTMEEVIRDLMGSLGLTRDEALKHLQDRYKNGGSVRGRRDALPMVEGDHVVPAHAVKGNEGGLAALSKKLMGNKNYDGMIRGPGGPREDAIKTRVYAAGGGISGKMDNLQNPFNSVPARVSDKEYVIPRQAITNLGMMNGAREGDANKAGQDIIYQLVENLKRKA